MLALLDADIIAYRCACTCEKIDEEYIPLARTNELVENILRDTKADSYKLYLSPPKNFRHRIYPEYKANRTQPSPRWLQVCKSFLQIEWGAEVVVGMEADDAIGINATSTIGNSCICTIDKDLNQIEGLHYNFVTKAFTEINKERAVREFYTQLLVGDPGDNIKGCFGIGKVKAHKLLEGAGTADEMFDTVRQTYKNDKLMLLNGQLLYIWRKENDLWDDPRLKPDDGIKQETAQQ